MGIAQSLRALVGQFSGAHDDYEDDYDDDDACGGPAELENGSGERAARPFSVVRPPRIEFSLVTPRDFADSQEIADRLRAGAPVIVDLQNCGCDESKRLTDFCSGLSYALEGSLQCIGETVVLLAPRNFELSSDAVDGLNERRFFNQV
jgi:cell division inhibitor SepF